MVDSGGQNAHAFLVLLSRRLQPWQKQRVWQLMKRSHTQSCGALMCIF